MRILFFWFLYTVCLAFITCCGGAIVFSSSEAFAYDGYVYFPPKVFEKLLAAAQAGDQEALEQVIKQYDLPRKAAKWYTGQTKRLLQVMLDHRHMMLLFYTMAAFEVPTSKMTPEVYQVRTGKVFEPPKEEPISCTKKKAWHKMLEEVAQGAVHHRIMAYAKAAGLPAQLSQWAPSHLHKLIFVLLQQITPKDPGSLDRMAHLLFRLIDLHGLDPHAPIGPDQHSLLALIAMYTKDKHFYEEIQRWFDLADQVKPSHQAFFLATNKQEQKERHTEGLEEVREEEDLANSFYDYALRPDIHTSPLCLGQALKDFFHLLHSSNLWRCARKWARLIK